MTERRRRDAVMDGARGPTGRRGADLRAEEEAALRRVATLVARGVAPTTVFEVVVSEVSALLDAGTAVLVRYDPDDSATICAISEESAAGGARIGGTELDCREMAATVRRTGRAARVGGAQGNQISGIGAPIAVDGELWGALIVSSGPLGPSLGDAERRLPQFSELIATAIANAESRAQLAASRARVVAAGTEERQRIVSDLHDGAQQRLVHAMIILETALRKLEPGDGDAHALVRDALDQVSIANSELRELVHGILPAVLVHSGLRAAVRALAARIPLAITVAVSPQRFPSVIESTAYFVASEALMNVVKHASARVAEVAVHSVDHTLQLEVRDDGVGGADPGQGAGLTGLRDLVEALGGTIEIISPVGGGTSVVARIPL